MSETWLSSNLEVMVATQASEWPLNQLLVLVYLAFCQKTAFYL